MNCAELTGDTLCVAVARVGWPDQKISVHKLQDMLVCEMGHPLHSLVVVGKIHPLECDFLHLFNPDIVLPC